MKEKGRRDGGETSGEVKALGATHPIISCAGEEGSCLSAGLLNCTLSDSTTGPVEGEAVSHLLVELEGQTLAHFREEFEVTQQGLTPK